MKRYIVYTKFFGLHTIKAQTHKVRDGALLLGEFADPNWFVESTIFAPGEWVWCEIEDMVDTELIRAELDAVLRSKSE